MYLRMPTDTTNGTITGGILQIANLSLKAVTDSPNGDDTIVLVDYDNTVIIVLSCVVVILLFLLAAIVRWVGVEKYYYHAKMLC